MLKKIFNKIISFFKQGISDKNKGILSDKDIINRLSDDLIISDVDLNNIQPASVDLKLGSILKKLDGTEYDLQKESYILEPNEFILGSTKELVSIPTDLVAQVDGKSSIGRLGIAIHITAGFIDPGFKGNITLEIHNCSDKAFELTYDMCICQIVFMTLSSTCEKPYGHEDRNNHYQNSHGTILSRYER